MQFSRTVSPIHTCSVMVLVESIPVACNSGASDELGGTRDNDRSANDCLRCFIPIKEGTK